MGRIMCEECDVSFTMKKNLHTHMKKKHNKDLLAHEKKHIMERIMCEECDASFTMRKNLYFHVRKIHRKDPLAHKRERMGRIMCEECDASFTLKRNLYSHVRKIHRKEPLEHKKEHRVVSKKDNSRRIMCKECDASYCMKKNLYFHMRKVHGKDPLAHKKEHKVMVSKKKNSRRSRIGCPIENCNEYFMTHANLRKHVEHDHQIEIDYGEFEFESLSAFQHWKDKVEDQSFSSYVRQTSFTVQTNGDQKGFLDCHRSYSYNTKGHGLRPIKNIGTNKIGKVCPSRMEVLIKNKGQGPILVKFWMTHIGHSLEVERIHLNKKTRAKIAGKIINGETYDEILDEFRGGDSSNEEQQRIQLLKKKDIHNIVRDFNLNKVAAPANEDVELNVQSIEEQYMESDQDYTYTDDDTRDEEPQQLKPSNKEYITQTIVPDPYSDFEIENMDGDNNIIFEVVDSCESQQPQPEQPVHTQEDIKKKAELFISLCEVVSLTDEECRSISFHFDKIIETIMNKSKIVHLKSKPKIGDTRASTIYR